MVNHRNHHVSSGMLPVAFTFIEASNNATSIDDLNAQFSEAARQMGFPVVFVGAATHPQTYGSESPILHNTMNVKWIEHYLGQDYAPNDPVVRNVASRNLPFRWSELPLETKLQRQLMHEAQDVGMREGIAVPIHGVNQDLFFVSLVTDIPDAMAGISLPHLRLMTVQLQSSYLRLANNIARQAAQMPLLTPREKDCLSFCAMGKTSWEIGQILGITEKTVDFHLANAALKLDANSRILAVVKALRLGLIMP